MTTPHPSPSPARPRRPRARRVAAPIAGMVLLAAVPATAEPPPAGNLVANPSFERDPASGWDGYRASFSSLALAPGEAPDGVAAVQVVAGPTADALEGFAIDDDAPSGGAAVPAGTQFTASAYIRAQSAQSIGKVGKVWVRERTAGDDLIDRVSGDVVLTGAFQLVTTPLYTTRRAGSRVDVYVAQNPATPGDSFAADLVTLARNLPPAGEITTSDTSPAVGATVTFGSARVVDPEGLGVATRAWDVDGGTDFTSGTEPTVSRRFDRAGTYVIRLRSSDAAGATSVLTRVVTVTATGAPLPPAAAPGAPGLLSGLRVTTRRGVTVARFRLAQPLRISLRVERKRVGRAGYTRVRALAKRYAAGTRRATLGRRLTAGRYRVRLVLRPATGPRRTVVKAFRVR